MELKVNSVNEAGEWRYSACGIKAGMRCEPMSINNETVKHRSEKLYYVWDKDRFYHSIALRDDERHFMTDFMNAAGGHTIFRTTIAPYLYSAHSPMPSLGNKRCLAPIGYMLYQMALNENDMVGLNQMQRDALLFLNQKEMCKEVGQDFWLPKLYGTRAHKRLTKAGAAKFAKAGATQDMWVGQYRTDKPHVCTPLLANNKLDYTFMFNQSRMIRFAGILEPEDCYMTFEAPDVYLSAPLLGPIYIDKKIGAPDVTRQTVFGPFYDYPTVIVHEATIPELNDMYIRDVHSDIAHNTKWNLTTVPEFIDVELMDGDLVISTPKLLG